MIGDFFSLVDSGLAWVLGDVGRFICWSLIAGAASMALYALVSPQRKLNELKEESFAIRKALAEHQGDFSDAWVLIRRNLSLSMRRLWLALGPSFLAGLPVIFILLWMEGTYAYRLPESGTTMEVHVEPATAEINGEPTDEPGVWQVQWPDPKYTVSLKDAAGTELVTLPMATPTPTVAKWQWWNALVSNPVGYLPAESPVESVTLQLPDRQILSFGPEWMRYWLTVFLILTCVSAIFTKVWFKIT